MLRLNPTITFENSARDALTFYQAALGGELDLTSYADYKAADPTAEVTEADEQGVVYGVLRTEQGLRIQAHDSFEASTHTPDLGIEVSGQPEDLDYLKRAFESLSEGGTVTVPFVEASWGGGDWWGLLTDKFGVTWNFIAHPEGKYL